MHCKRLLTCLLLGLCFFLTAQTIRADAVYLVTLNTAPLIGHPAGPFSINFQFNAGSGPGANNTATLSDFQFGMGGGAVGSAMLTGGASGDLSTGVTLTDSSFFNDFTQQFTPGSLFGFTLSLTTNVDAGGIPDQFSFAILDSGGTELPTLSSFFDVFIAIDIDSMDPTVMAFGSDPNRSPAAGGNPIDTGPPTVQRQTQVIPEPATLFLLSTGLAGCVAAVRRRRTGVADTDSERR